MATLVSEDQEQPLTFTLKAGSHNQRAAAGEDWQEVSIELVSPEYTLKLGGATQDCFLCRHPQDELQELVEQLTRLLEGSQEQVFFEPAEPSFELNIASTPQGGYAVHCWLDAGNATTGFYRWDAVGVRFYTTKELLNKFAQELLSEFPTLTESPEALQ